MRRATRRVGLDWSPLDDPLGAFCRDNHVALDPSSSGSLDGFDFAAKDVIDVIGSTTGFGQPDWLRTHAPADASAIVIDRLLGAGARLVGRTISDELSYSLSGENLHYGTPANPAAADRIPGGSSSGSVSAVAGGLVDFFVGYGLRWIGTPAGELLRCVRHASDPQSYSSKRHHSIRAELRYAWLVCERASHARKGRRYSSGW